MTINAFFFFYSNMSSTVRKQNLEGEEKCEFTSTKQEEERGRGREESGGIRCRQNSGAHRSKAKHYMYSRVILSKFPPHYNTSGAIGCYLPARERVYGKAQGTAMEKRGARSGWQGTVLRHCTARRYAFYDHGPSSSLSLSSSPDPFLFLFHDLSLSRPFASFHVLLRRPFVSTEHSFYLVVFENPIYLFLVRNNTLPPGRCGRDFVSDETVELFTDAVVQFEKFLWNTIFGGHQRSFCVRSFRITLTWSTFLDGCK